MGSATWTKRRYNVQSYIIFISNSLISKALLNSFSNSFSKFSSTFSDLTTLYLLSSTYYKIYRFSLSIHKSPKPSFYHLFYNRCWPPQTLSLILSHIQRKIFIFEQREFSFLICKEFSSYYMNV